MVRTELPYTYCSRKQLAPKGGPPRWKEYWRYRRGEIDTPLPGRPGDATFHTRYGELMAQAEARETAAGRAKAGALTYRSTFEFLCEEYLASAEYLALAESTQADYAMTINERLIPALGPERYDCINRASVKVVRDEVAKTHSARTANKVKQMVSRLYSWADEEDLLPDAFVNPGMKLKRLKGKVKPIEVWSAEEIALFLAQTEGAARTALMLALYTGQRREDLVQMQWSDCLGDMIRVRQNKTGEPLTIPCHSRLREHLDALRTNFGGPILRGQDGKVMNAGQLSSTMNRAVAKVEGMPHRSLHGLRYAAAGALEESGCSVVQISSIVGHRTYQMAIKYARQRHDAEAAMKRLEQRA